LYFFFLKNEEETSITTTVNKSQLILTVTRSYNECYTLINFVSISTVLLWTHY